MKTAAQFLTQRLEQYDVSCVFGIPGVHTLELYRGLQDTKINHITPRHEQGAGFMADGYARVSGKPGVCFIITGPGMTNIVTAMGQAYSESIPMLVISSVNAHGRMGSGDGWLHELPDQQALVNGVCAFSHTVHHPDEIEQVLARAFAVFDSQRPRPVHIEIPINVLKAECSKYSDAGTSPMRLMRPVANLELIRQAAVRIRKAKKPAILVGGGAIAASHVIKFLATHMDAPVIMSVNARGVLPFNHPLSVSASASSPAVRSLIKSSDLIIGLGCEIGSTDYDFFEDSNLSIPDIFIRVDIDAQQIVRNKIPKLGLVGDALTTAEQLIHEFNSLDTESSRTIENDRTAETSAGALRASKANIQLQSELSNRDKRYVETLATIRDTLPNVVIAGDSTQIIYAGNYALGMPHAASYFNSAMGYGTLGFALPAAIGAAIANPERTIVAISGDGGLQFCLAELATAIDQHLPIILIVHENGGYHEIEKSMHAEGIEPLGVEIGMPNLTLVAESFGWQYAKPESISELSEELKNVSANNKATVVVLQDKLFEPNA